DRFHCGRAARAAHSNFPGRRRARTRPVSSQTHFGRDRTSRCRRRARRHEGTSPASARGFSERTRATALSAGKIFLHIRRAEIMANLGFVGLGVMGSEMVARLLSKGHTVTGYNRTRSKAEWLVKKGMKWA